MNALRWLLPRLPLPMLALAASYGVYQFALLFVPQWVAVVQAAAFELTYIGLATLDAKGNLQRRKAIAISLGAVIVSVLYNWLAGFFHRNPETLIGLDLWKEAGLAFLHGAPLAIVAYLVSDLLLHNNAQEVEPSLQDASEPDTIDAIMQPVRIEQPAPQPILQNLIADLQPEAMPIAEEAADFWGDMEEPKLDEQPVLQPEPALDDMLAHFRKTREEVIAMLKQYGMWNKPPEQVYSRVKRYVGLPENITSEVFVRLFAELKSGTQDSSQKPAGISDDAWRAWRMCKYQGMSQAEVAAIMGKSISTISRYCSKVDEAMPEEVAA